MHYVRLFKFVVAVLNQLRFSKQEPAQSTVVLQAFLEGLQVLQDVESAEVTAVNHT